MSTERMTFDEACRDLGITEAELEQLVAAGEIASIKEGDTLYFKREVVRKFKKSREVEPTILLADDEISLVEAGAEGEIDLLELDDEEGTTPKKAAPAAAAPAAGAPAGRAAGPVPARPGAAKPRERESSVDDELALPEIDLDLPEDEVAGVEVEVGPRKTEAMSVKGGKKKDPEPAGDETLLNLDGLLEDDSEATTPVPGAQDDSTLLDTDLLDLGGDADPFSSDTVEETAVDLTEQGTLLRGGGARVMQMKRKESHAPFTVVLAAAGLALMLPLGIMTNLIFAHSPAAKDKIAPAESYSWITDFNFLDGVVEWLADTVKSKK